VRKLRGFCAGLHDAVVNPQQQRRQDPDARNHPPDAFRLMPDFAEVVNQKAAKPSRDNGT